MNPHFIHKGVTPLDRGTYLVDSAEVPGRQYTVDLTSYFGAGKCDCWDYRSRREKLNSHIGPSEDAKPNRCKHIREARNFVADLATAGFMKGDGRKYDGP